MDYTVLLFICNVVYSVCSGSVLLVSSSFLVLYGLYCRYATFNYSRCWFNYLQVWGAWCGSALQDVANDALTFRALVRCALRFGRLFGGFVILLDVGGGRYCLRWPTVTFVGDVRLDVVRDAFLLAAYYLPACPSACTAIPAAPAITIILPYHLPAISVYLYIFYRHILAGGRAAFSA